MCWTSIPPKTCLPSIRIIHSTHSYGGTTSIVDFSPIPWEEHQKVFLNTQFLWWTMLIYSDTYIYICIHTIYLYNMHTYWTWLNHFGFNSVGSTWFKTHVSKATIQLSECRLQVMKPPIRAERRKRQKNGLCLLRFSLRHRQDDARNIKMRS